MFSPILRFVLSKFRHKNFKFSILLSISVFTFCLILIFTTFYSRGLSYKQANGPGSYKNQADNNLDHWFLLYNLSETSVQSGDSEVTTDPNGVVVHSFSNSSKLWSVTTNWTERPWFLTNGTLRINGSEASNLALWPDQCSDLKDDRILNQLMYIPIDYNQTTTPLKSIYLSASDKDWKLSLGRQEFLGCPVSSCQLVSRDNAKDADLIFFKSRYDYKYFMKKRKSTQIWAKFEIESPQNVMIIAPKDTINWTVTYRHDSDIPAPYYKFYPYEKRVHTNRTRNYAANKRRKVAWFVSNCFATNSRLQYAKELRKYIDVDIYGKCGPLKCARENGSLCWKLLESDYKFYLSFENSNCLDYITEKFWFNGLMHDILPIVMGAHPSTYKQLAPPNSYIHVDDFQSPQHLAQYLNLLDSNDDLYNKYYDWKRTGIIQQIYMWCRVCALLHAPKHLRVYHDLGGWWNSPGTCVPITWTNMTVNNTDSDNRTLPWSN